VKILKILSQYNHFPRLIKYSNEYLITEYISDTLNYTNIPLDIHSQIKRILKILSNEGISHNDIKPHELLVKDGMLYLVDFGFATIKGEYIPNQTPNQIQYEDKVAIDIILHKILELQRKYFLPRLKKF